MEGMNTASILDNDEIQKYKQDWREQKDIQRNELMTEEERLEVDNLMVLLNNDCTEMQELYDQWSKEEEAYRQKQPENPDDPNSRINIILPVIEGEITQIVDNNWQVTAVGEEPGDDIFADDALIGLEWALNKNDLFKKMTVHERRRNKHGVAFMKVRYDHNFAGGFGCPIIDIVPINKLIVDGKIKNFLRWQEADYIAEKIVYSKSYAYERYGPEKASAISYGVDEWRDDYVFEENYTFADENSFTLLEVWSRFNGKLRVREISSDGILLWDSAKKGERTDNQRETEFTDRPIYKYVNNLYPHFITNKYTSDGRLHGFGDATILLPLQNLVNELYDKIRILMRPNLIAYDVNSDLDLTDIDKDMTTPRGYDGRNLQGGPPLYSIPWGAVNSDVFHLVQDIKQEAQRVARFNDIMIGQGRTADTATEAAIQQQQGNSHTTHEKTTLEHTLSDVCKYMLGLMMEYITEGKAFRLFGERAKNAKDMKYAWVDFSSMTNVPGMIPASQEYKDKFKTNNPGVNIPQWEVLENTDETEDETIDKVIKNKRKTQTKHLELDINISMGSGLPKNKAFLWQMIERLCQLAVPDVDDPQMPIPKPIITWREMRNIVKDFMDLPIDNDKNLQEFVDRLREMQKQQLAQRAPTTAQAAGQAPNQSADQNLTQGGNPQMAMANQAKQGGGA